MTPENLMIQHAAAAFCLAVAALFLMGAMGAGAWRVIAFGLFVFLGLFIAFSFGTAMPINFDFPR